MHMHMHMFMQTQASHYLHTIISIHIPQSQSQLQSNIYLRPIQSLIIYACVFWLQGRQALRPQPRHSKMNQCPVELQKEQFHWSRLVSDLMLFHEVCSQLGIVKAQG